MAIIEKEIGTTKKRWQYKMLTKQDLLSTTKESRSGTG